MIVGQPSDTDVMQIGAVLCQISYPIPYDTEKGTHNLTGAILGDLDYKMEYGERFPIPTCPAAYDASITADTSAFEV